MKSPTSSAIARTLGLLILLSFPLAAQGTLTYFFEGVAAGDRLGDSVAAAGDVNADGFGDVIVGVPYDATVGGGAGLARVYSGADGSLLHTFYADAPGDKFGEAVSGAGDVNADGYDDLIVGAPLADASGNSAGRARVFSGFDGSVLLTFTGDVAGDTLGSSVAGGIDANGDGYDDLIVGIEADDPGFPNAGSVRVFSGFDGSLIYQLNGDTAQGRFGGSVANAGDVNGDGVEDVIVGAYRGNHNGLLSGSAKVFSGPTGALLFALGGDDANDEFGTSVSGLGDVNGDGHDDFIVGAPFDDNNGASSGNARVFSGLDASLLHDLDGDPADQFGSSVGRTDDVDGDGFADFIVGAPLADANASSCGEALVYSGFDGSLIYSVAGTSTSDVLGSAVSGAGDVNGDGFADIVVGMPGDDDHGSNSGEARVYTSPTLPTLVYSSEQGHLDLDLFWVPDGGNIQSLTGALVCDGATAGGLGLYGLSFAPADVLIPVGIPVLIAVDPINLIESGNFGFGFLGEVQVPNVTRQYPYIAGSNVYLQFFETSPIIRGSNGLRLLMSI